MALQRRLIERDSYSRGKDQFVLGGKKYRRSLAISHCFEKKHSAGEREREWREIFFYDCLITVILFYPADKKANNVVKLKALFWDFGRERSVPVVTKKRSKSIEMYSPSCELNSPFRKSSFFHEFVFSWHRNFIIVKVTITYNENKNPM